MGLFRRERRAVSFQDVWGTGGDWGDAAAKASDAMALSAVIACVNLRANIIGQLPLDAYRYGPDGSSLRVARQPLLVANPNPKVTRSVWLRQMSISRDLWGNAIGLIVGRDAAGYPSTVEWLNPQTVRFDESTGRLAATINAFAVPVADLLIVPSFVVPGSQVGIAPLRRTGLVDLNRRAQDFGADWFRNGAVPSMVVRADQELTVTQAQEISDRMTAKWRARKPAVIGAGLSVDQFAVKADESQFLETLRHVQVDICQVFGVPPEEIGIATAGSSVTYANREQRVQQILVNSLNADLVVVQEILTANTARPQFVRFNTGALLRSDLATRYASYQTAITAGFLDVNEVRALEDRPPIGSPVTPGGVDGENHLPIDTSKGGPHA